MSLAPALAQIGSTFFGASFPSGFVSPFSDFSASIAQLPGQGGSRPMQPSNPNGNGPILFPPSPESRDTSGVVIGASGYGFVPPGGKGPVQGRGMPPQLPPQAFTASFGSSPFSQSFFHL
ncbi:hypothetical protein RUM43_001572 [Polyplax serrata]|uniref:Uncharacterized protein n=1 Tax=Polyplax serrata TaxID=468196 RepID=A0AAN8XSD0_POLSC